MVHIVLTNFRQVKKSSKRVREDKIVMLIDDIVVFCDKKYTTYGDKCGCGTCNHPSGKCTGGCYNCLYQIHFPKNETIQKLEYDCPKMLYRYVCQFSTRYASEILYALREKEAFLSAFDNFNIMSIGCGGCADLMAFEQFYNDYGLTQKIDYRGYDINRLWIPIHNRVSKYCDEHGITKKFMAEDAIDYFQKYYNSTTNIIVISYLISYLYNTAHKNDILNFFDLIIENVILRNDAKKLIIFNDVNSCYRGRDYFPKFIEKLKKNGLHSSLNYLYFDSDKLNKYQKNGDPYQSNLPLFRINENIKRKYHIDDYCRSAQLIVEVK